MNEESQEPENDLGETGIATETATATDDQDESVPADEDMRKQQPQIYYFERRRQYTDRIDTEGSSVWLISFTDVIALMLTFFVLLYAMSDPIRQKWDNKMGITPYNTARYSAAAGEAGTQESVNLNRLSFQQAENLNYAQAVLQELLNESGAGMPVDIGRSGNELRLSFADALFFPDENGEFSSETLALLARMGPVLDNLENSLAVTGFAPAADHETMFADVQQFAKALKESDYSKPLALAVSDAGPDKAIELILRPHDGYRITR